MNKPVKRIGFVLISGIILLLGIAHVFITMQVVTMPGDSFRGVAPTPGPEFVKLVGRVQGHVGALAYDRSIYNPEGLRRAGDYVEGEFRKLGFIPNKQPYFLEADVVKNIIDQRSKVGLRHERYEVTNQKVTNYWIRVPGKTTPQELMVVGAHYDTVSKSPGAYDNAAGVAVMLEITRQLLQNPPDVSVILVAFTCEEYPAGVPETGGSERFADWLLKEREKRGLKPPFGMISLDTLGNFSDQEGSQRRPFPLQLYIPDKGNFVAFVGEYSARPFIAEMIGNFRTVAEIPSKGLSIPKQILPDILRSDHTSFVNRGIPGFMITDTANFRVPNPYHTSEDTPEKIDYPALARIVDGLVYSIQKAQAPEEVLAHGSDEGVGLGD